METLPDLARHPRCQSTHYEHCPVFEQIFGIGIIRTNEEKITAKGNHGFFDPGFEYLSEQHSQLTSRHEMNFAVNDFVAGLLLVIGSVLTETAGTWLLLIASILFTVHSGIKDLRN